MAKVKADDAKLKVRTVSLPMDLYDRLQPIVEAAVAVGESESFVLRQVARIALQRKWTATFLEVPSEVTRERDRDRVTPRLALPPAMDEQVFALAEYSAFSRWFTFAVERFLVQYRKGDPHLFDVLPRRSS